MNGNFQNNYSGGWNDVPFNGFNQEQFNYNYQQMPAQYNNNKYLPHQAPTQYADNMKLPHQTPAHYVDNKQLPPQMPTQHIDNKQLPPQMPTQRIDNRQLPNQMPTQYVDNRQIPHQTPMQNVDNRQLPHQTLMQNVDNQQLPHQMPMQNFDNSQLLHQMPVQTQYVDTRQLPQQTPMENVDNNLLPPHMPMQNFDNRQFLHQTPAQMQYVDDRQLPPQMPMHNVDNRQLPHHMPMQNFDHRQLLQQTPAQMQYIENRQLSPQMPMHNVDNRQLLHQIPMQSFENSQLHQMPTQTQYVDNRQPMLNVDNRPLPHQMAMQSFDNSHLLHQTPTQTQYVDNRALPHQTALENVDDKQLPHHMPMQNFDNRPLLHQTPAQMQYVEDMQLSPQTPMHNVDNRQLPHHMPMQNFDNRPLLHQTPAQMQYVEDMQLSPQTPMHNVDNRQLPHQMPMQNFDNRQLLHQTPAQMQYVENRQLSPQAPMQNVDNRQLLHHMPMQNFDNRQLLDQTPTQMQYVDNRQLSPQVPTQFIGNCRLPHPMPTQYVDNSQLLHQVPTQTQYVDNSQLPHQMPTQYVDNRQLPHQVPPQYVDNRQLPHQMPPQYVDNGQLPHHMPTQSVDNSQLPHHTPAQYVDNIQFPHHTPTQYVDKRSLPHQMPTQHVDNRQLPHQMPTQHVDNRQLPHQQSAQLVDNRQLPHQMPAQHVDNRKLPPHQMLEQDVDNKQVPHQMPAQHVDNRQVPHQMPTQHVDNRQLPHQQSAQLVDNRQLPHQMPAHFAVNRDLPQQTPEDRADKFLPPLIHCDICNITMIPECLKEHDNGKIHQRLLLELRQMPEGYADKKWSPQQMPKVTADKRPLPHEKPEYFDDELCLTPLPPLAHCEICGITMIPTSLEQHYNGKRHKKMLLKLRKQSAKHKTSNGEESRHIQDSQINPVVQPKKVPKFKKVSRPVENMSLEARGSHWYKDSKRKHRNHIRAMVFKNKKFPAESSKRKVRDNMNAKDRGFKCKIGGPTGSKYMKMNNGKRRRLKSSNPGVNALSNSVELPELTPSSGCVASPKTAPIPTEESSFELQSQHVSASLSQNTVEKIDQPQSTPVELNASTGSNKTEFMSSDFAAIAPPQVPATSQVFTPPPAVGSSFEPKIHIDSQKEATEAKEHREIQNHAMERNDQPDSISMEFHTPAGSDINTLIEDSCSHSGAIVIAPPQSPIASSQVSTPVAVIDTEMSESKVHNEIQNHIIVDSNDHQHLVSMELQDDPAGSITNNQTEVVNSDSTAIQVVIEPLASAPPDADVSLSCFEALTEHGLSTEMEPEVSESVAYFDSKYPTKQTNIELLPSLTMEIDALPEVSAETETEDGSSQVEVEMDVVATESKITKLPQVSVCLACGDEGFEETLVYCNKCKACSLHRYCLDGPVIFTDEVIWFCEDCEQEVVDVDYPVEDTTDTEKGEIDSIEDCMTVVYPQPIADPIWRGSLQVVHKSNDKITGLMGHLSTLACPKVLEETRHLPTVLNADLLQRSAVWPASFAKFGTNYQSIGLYFFPQNERFEKYYDQLVDEMISNDLAIRARVEKSELLIFPSTTLPNQYKRFQSKYYLWGIFKRKQAASTIKDS